MKKDNDVPAGYKQTEVGVIPEDWEVKKICDVAEVIGGGTPSTFTQKYWNGNINWFTPTEIGFNKYSYESLRKITEEGLKDSSAKLLPIGTILLTSRASIGDVSILKVPASTNQGFQSLIANENIDNEFLYYLISTLKNTLIKYASGSTFLEISPNKLKSIVVPLPPTKAEQTAIATALNDADALITALEKLISKKRNIKQGAMQELLKPKEDWEVKKLGEIFQLSASYSKSKFIIDGGKFIIMDMGSISIDGKIIKSKTTNLQKDILEVGDLIMPKDDIGGGNIIGKVGFIDKRNTYVLGDHVYRLKCIDVEKDTLFFHHLINSIYVKRNLRMKASGSAQLGLGRKNVEEQEVYFPKTKVEQTRISQILSDMDTEIEALEKKLEKYKAIKQGMMQNLLTGKIRLVLK